MCSETLKWTELTPSGVGPKPRRRQCCVMVDTKLFLFGGTRQDNHAMRLLVQLIIISSDFSPKEPRSEVTNQQEVWVDEPDLTDHSDLYMLDFCRESAAVTKEKSLTIIVF